MCLERHLGIQFLQERNPRSFSRDELLRSSWLSRAVQYSLELHMLLSESQMCATMASSSGMHSLLFPFRNRDPKLHQDTSHLN